jgi:hypothetical protein
VQVLTRRGRELLSVGSPNTDVELELLQAACERLNPGQLAFDLGDLERVPAKVDAVADWTGRGAQPRDAPGAPSARRPSRRGGKAVGSAGDSVQ